MTWTNIFQRGKSPFSMALVQIALMALAVLGDDGLCLGVAQVLDALLRDEVELHPEALVRGVDEAEGVAAEAVHVAIGERDAAIAHDDRDLVQRLGQRGPEVPVVLRAAQVGARVALHGVVEVRELERVAQEEDRRVVADEVPVALFGVELHGEAADVALGVGRAALAGHGGEAHEHLGLLADGREDLGLGVAGDVVGDGEGAVGARALGVHPALGDHLAVEVGELLQEPDVLEQGRPAAARGHDVLVVDDGRARRGGQLLLACHVSSSGAIAPVVRRLAINGSRLPGWRPDGASDATPIAAHQGAKRRPGDGVSRSDSCRTAGSGHPRVSSPSRSRRAGSARRSTAGRCGASPWAGRPGGSAAMSSPVPDPPPRACRGGRPSGRGTRPRRGWC